MPWGLGWDDIALGAISPVGMVARNAYREYQGKQDLANPAQARLEDRDYITGQIRSALGDVQNRPPPRLGPASQATAARIGTAGSDQWRGQQQQLATQQMGIASGQMQGAGELASQRQAARAIAAQAAGAASARGPGAALAGRTAARNTADIGLNAAGQAQQAALQDQSAAMAGAAQTMGQGRAADIELATQQAGFQQATGLANQNANNQQAMANLQARLQMTGMNDAQRAQMIQQMIGVNQSEMAGRLGLTQAQMAQPGFWSGLLQQGGQMGAAAIASDERLKDDIKDGGADVDAMLDEIRPTTWSYKSEARSLVSDALKHGRVAGIIAQDLQKSAAGAKVVIDTPAGKLLDTQGAVSAVLAAAARLNQRVRALEAAKGA